MKKGFTLIEMIVTLVVSMILITTVTFLVVNLLKGFSINSSVSTLQEDAMTLNEILTDRVYYAASVEILPDLPATCEDDKYYIYSDLDENTIMYKKGKQSAEILYDGISDKQTAVFSKVDDNTFETSYTIQKKDLEYDLLRKISLQNAIGGDGITGTTGKCISFSFNYKGSDGGGGIENPPIYLEGFMFSADNNTNSNLNITEDIIGEIDEAKRSVYIDVPFKKPNLYSNNSFWLKASIDINVTSDFVTIDKQATNTKYIRMGTGTRVASIPKLSYITPRKIFVQRNDGRYKVYTVYVNYKKDVETATASDLDIVPTKVGVSPTNRYGRIIRENVYMPADENSLNAIFKLEKNGEEVFEGFYIEWYAVTEEELLQFKDGTKSNYSDYVVHSSTEDRTLNITEKNRDKIVGKYVFYRVVGKEGNDYGTEIASTLDGDITLTDNIDDKTSYVYVTLDYGKMWESTLNEIDFDYGSTFMQNSLRNSYMKAPEFQKYYEMYEGDDMKYMNAHILAQNVSKYKFNTLDGKSAPKALFEPFDKYNKIGGFLYTPDLVKKELNIKGNRAEPLPVESWINSKFLAKMHTGLLSIPQYHDFYKDKRNYDYFAFFDDEKNVDDGIRIGIKHNKPENSLGGFSIGPNTKAKYTDYGILYDYGYAPIGNGGYFLDFVYQRAAYEQSGVKMVAGTDQKGYDFYSSNMNIGANNYTRNSVQGTAPWTYEKSATTPYLFDEVETDQLKYKDLIGKEMIIDTYFTRVKKSQNGGDSNAPGLITVLVSNASENYLKPMYFGGFKQNSSFMENYNDSYFKDTNIGDKDKGAYLFDSIHSTEPIVIRGVDEGDSKKVSGSYEDNYISALENKYFSFTAWNYVTDPNGDVDNAVGGNIDVTITNITSIDTMDRK